MKMIISSLACLAMMASLSSSCAGNDDDLGRIEIPSADYTLPQGKDAAADAVIVSLYQKYGTYFLYDFTEKDFQWSQVSANSLDTKYRFDPIEATKVANLMEAIQHGWLYFYSDSFLKKSLPYKVLLAEDVQTQERTFDWGSWEYVVTWVNKPSRHIANQMAIGNVSDKWDNMSASQKRKFKSYVQTDFLQYCLEQGLVTIPDEFYAVSDYSIDMGWSATAEDARKAGFVYDPQTDLEWSTDGTITKTADINAFIASLVYRTDDEWTDDLQYDYVKRKYEILVSAFSQAGIDIKRIGNATF